MASLSGPDAHGVFQITFDSQVSKDHRFSRKMFRDLWLHLDAIERNGGDPLYSSDAAVIFDPNLAARSKEGSSRLSAPGQFLGRREPVQDPEERAGKKTAVLLTGGKSSKFFSNGFDFDYLGSDWKGAFEDLHRLCARLLTFPVLLFSLVQDVLSL